MTAGKTLCLAAALVLLPKAAWASVPGQRPEQTIRQTVVAMLAEVEMGKSPWEPKRQNTGALTVTTFHLADGTPFLEARQNRGVLETVAGFLEPNLVRVFTYYPNGKIASECVLMAEGRDCLNFDKKGHRSLAYFAAHEDSSCKNPVQIPPGVADTPEYRLQVYSKDPEACFATKWQEGTFDAAQGRLLPSCGGPHASLCNRM